MSLASLMVVSSLVALVALGLDGCCGDSLPPVGADNVFYKVVQWYVGEDVQDPNGFSNGGESLKIQKIKVL